MSESRTPAQEGGRSAAPTFDAWDGVPEVVGRYSIFGRIASGGMATVHLGRQLGHVGFSRTVAIKKLHAHLAEDPDFVLAFVDEARMAARIQHPNVVSTLDVVSEKGKLLLVMEYVMGESLVRLLRLARARGDFVPPRIAASVVSSALHGLHAAHEAKNDRGEPMNLVHRDVSPQNILIGADGVTRVLDFGVAKAMGRIQATDQGMLKGKIAYMSPEQVRGATVDRRCDVYAAGVVLWETLTGRRMFQAETQVELFARVAAGCPGPPSQHVPDLPEAFDELTMRALRTDPNERFATAREMALALEACAGIAMPSEVGPWVTSLAGDSLVNRARAVAEVESASDIVVRSSDAPPKLTAADDSTHLGTSGVHLQADAPATGGEVRRRAFVALGILGVFALLLLTWVIASRTGSPAETPAAVAAPGPPTVGAPPATTAAPPQAPASATASLSTATPAPIAAQSPAATATAAPRPSPPPGAAAIRPQSAAAARTPARANCVPPYTLDNSGFRVPKPECM
jgi:eukaryotic-like serine/threonine-protein kinase